MLNGYTFNGPIKSKSASTFVQVYIDNVYAHLRSSLPYFAWDCVEF